MKRAFLANLFISLFIGVFAQIAPKPIDKKATKEAIQLYDYLRKDVWGKKVISGCQARWDYNTTDAQDIQNAAGKYPALNIFDFQHFRMDHIDYMADTALQWHKSGGLVGFIWHWSVPVDPGFDLQQGYSFYLPSAAGPQKKGTTFSPQKALQEGTPENKQIHRDLEAITKLLLHYQSQGIPIIWRPLHEAAGNSNRGGTAWFWWGNDGAEAFKQLYLYMQKYLMDHGVHNLIYVWTSELDDDNWYPGDAYVDIVARDQYRANNNHSAYKEQFDILKKKYPNKMLALAECDCMPGAKEMVAEEAMWLYVAPWTVPFVFGSNNTPEFWKSFLYSDTILTKDEIQIN